MDAIFSELTAEENEQLLDAIPLITLLIGTADGNFDIHESSWAQRVVKFRSFTNDQDLKEYYIGVGQTFEPQLNHFIREMPDGLEEKTAYLSAELEKMNPLIAKLNGHDAYRLYNDFLSFAKHVAKASGGFLYMANVSPREKALLDLPMVKSIDTYPGI